MQLTHAPAAGAFRAALRVAACALLAGGVATIAAAQPAPVAPESPTWQLETSGLFYGEMHRTRVFEPAARITRLFAHGQSVTAALDFDAITGASPSGAQPSGVAQTTTTPSGNTKVTPAGEIPLTDFRDVRGAVDLEYVQPLGSHLTATTGGHFSKERDYRSLGGRAQLSLEAFQRLSTFTAGWSVNADVVTPLEGTRAAFTEDDRTGSTSEHKDSRSFLAGTSRVLTRRWLLGVTGTYSEDSGYLSDPYKLVSILDHTTGHTTSSLHERRPDRRLRRDLLASSAYHHATDVSYVSYRYYWDDWGVKAHTLDLKLRHDFDDKRFLMPHLRAYHQGPADFFSYGLRDDRPLPEFATSDYRLGTLNTATVGATLGFGLPDVPGQFTVRAELLRQWGKGFPDEAIGSQRTYNLAPGVGIGTVMAGWSVGW
ncbi:MAG: DUF3570 domain-containing protein [Candidatus Eisenbacteria bacterium]